MIGKRKVRSAMSDDRKGSDAVLLWILRASAFLCLAGWTWVHLYWEGPYGVLLWQDATYDLASRLGIDWDQFVGSGADDGWVQLWLGRIGWIYLAVTPLTLTAGRRSYVQWGGLAIASVMLFILSYAKYVASQYQLPMLVEHGGQILSPVLLATALALGVRHRVTLAMAMVAVVTTFAGHGSYAVGWWPTPGNFYAMITLVFGVEYESATALLHLAGVLDFVVCVAVFVPPVRRLAVGYAVLWGCLTSLARPVAGMSWDLNYWGADQYVHDAVLRAPHFLIPLYLFVLWKRRQSVDERDVEENV
ncbi:hypothetical protein [Crateriforma conspicua]|uniref:hypothetical protein n=1 Tax=Crateriforma conspicua TaxID=2527996 RepID=UPI00118C8B46|nr:hypothetical protein [Crateriforma conspicua]QDV62058.1 hypothetical protein Mal65_11860 [Crateriforma conspicua]